MTNRLPYETKGGYISEGETFSQLLEYLRMAQEACYTLSHIQDENYARRIGFKTVGDNFDRIIHHLTALATSSGRAQ